MANPSLLEQFCSDGQKDAVSTILQTAGWSPENPNINGYQLNTIFNELYTYINYLKNKGLSFWEDTKTYKATTGDIDIVRYGNKIYFAKLDSNLDGITPKAPDTNTTYWGILYDLDKPLESTYALLQGNNTKSFKVADAVNADEAVSKGQIVTTTPLVGSNVEQVSGKKVDVTAVADTVVLRDADTAIAGKNQCTAWVNFNSAGTILDSFNVSSVVRNSTGVYTINFTTPMVNAGYTVGTGGSDNVDIFSIGNGTIVHSGVDTRTVNSVQMNNIYPHTNALYDINVGCVYILGGK